LLAQYGSVALFLIIAILFALSMVLIPVILRFLKIVPGKPNPQKTSIFECGVETIGKTWVQFNFHYYYYALVFLALDVLAVFLFPWAISLRETGIKSLIVVAVVVFFVLIGYLYAWRKGALEWK